MNLYNSVKYSLVLTLVLNGFMVSALGISGPSTALLNETKTYTYDGGFVIIIPNWRIAGGTLQSSSINGTLYTATVKWTSVGAGQVQIKSGKFMVLSSLSVTVGGLPATPPTPYISSYICTSQILSRSGTPPAGVSWYWQTSTSGTSELFSNSTIRIANNGWNYLRAKSSFGWSSASAGVNVFINTEVPAAPVTTGAARCGTGNLTLTSNNVADEWFTAATGGTKFYTGSNYTTSFSSTITYYVESVTPWGCRSTFRAVVTATVSSPSVGGSVSGGGDAYDSKSGTLSLSAYNGSVIRWEKKVGSGSWTTISSTNTSLPFANILTTTSYRAIVKNGGCNEAASSVDVVTIYNQPTISISGPTAIPQGGSVTLTADLGHYAYQWLKNGVDMPGEDNNTVIINIPDMYKLRVQAYAGGPLFTTVGIEVTDVVANQNQNYLLSTTFLEPGVTANTNLFSLSGDALAQSITYLDGLGRPVQTVLTGQSPDGYDIVQPIEYDALGRQAKQFLPYIKTEKTGTFTVYLTRDANGSYTNTSHEQFYAVPPVNVTGDSRPYSETIFENSPLNRPIKQFGPGTNWYANGKAVETKYEINTDADNVKIWQDDALGKPINYEVNGNLPYIGGLGFDGANDYVALNMNYNAVQQIPNLTVEAWVRTTYSSSSWTSNWAIVDFDRSEYYNLYVSGDGTVGFSTRASSVHDMFSVNTVNDGQWHHVAVVYNGNVKKIYIDGIIDASINGIHSGAGLGSGKVRYGFIGDGSEATSFNGGRNNIYYDGDINEVRIWHSARSGMEIAGTKDQRLSGQEDNLMAYYIFNEGKDSSVLTDLTGNGYNGTLFNMDTNTSWLNQEMPSEYYYPAGELYKNITIDEESNEVQEFINKTGQTILKRVQAPSPDNWADTYYIYDDFGNLRFVLPPEASKQTSNSPDAAFLGNWVFQYKYDGRQRMVEKQVPGAEPVYMVYDKRNRLVLTQDGNQRPANQWLFTKYDQLNRPILTGFYTKVGDRSVLQTEADGISIYAENRSITVHGYTNIAYPNIANENDYLTVTYYDDYEYPHAKGTSSDYEYAEAFTGTILNESVKGQVTGGRTKVLDAQNTWLQSTVYYDDRYRVIQSIADNYIGGQDRASSKYSFIGNVLETYLNHSGNDNHTITQKFKYDHANRLLSVTHKLNNDPKITISANEYNELGDLIDKQLHSADAGTTFSQSVDYRYNIRGWLTRINDAGFADGEGDYFGMELAYEGAMSGISPTAMFNGNISATKWKAGGAGDVANAYIYSYDEMNRIKAADYKNLSTAMATGALDMSISSYDLNGNIIGLSRANLGGALSDQLSYTYKSGNQLSSVTDDGSIEEGFKDGNVGSVDYEYDANGNMVKDWNKDIQQNIIYNHLNLPTTVVMGNAGDKKIDYIYDAAGTKLAQIVTDGATIKRTDYAGGFIYEDNELQFILHEEGRIIPGETTNDPFIYQYNLKDHLGNVRLSFTTVDEPADEYLATMEPSLDGFETDYLGFTNLETRWNNNNYDHTDLFPASQKTYSARLNNAVAIDIIGPAKMLEVIAGDVVDLEVYATYTTYSGNNSSTVSGNQLIGAIATAFTPVGATAETTQQIFEQFNMGGAGSGLVSGTPDAGAPAAYLNYILYDVNFNYLDAGYQPINSTAASGFIKVSFAPLSINQRGYLYIYVSNETMDNVNVHFDDLKVTHHKSRILQMDDYYPFGLTFNSYTRPSAKKNDFLYNGKEMQDELDLNWLDYGARMYMSDIGRWGVIDPMSELMPRWSPYTYSYNNPLNYIDPSGAIPYPLLKLWNRFKRKKSPDGRFGERRKYYKTGDYHRGHDWSYDGGKSTDLGGTVVATHSGKVVQVLQYSSHNNAAGTYVKIQSPDGSFQTVYMHLDESMVKVEDNVKEGQQIGTIGESGKGKRNNYKDAAHLHYEIRKKEGDDWFSIDPFDKEGNMIDPQKWIDGAESIQDYEGEMLRIDVENFLNEETNKTGWDQIVSLINKFLGNE